MLHYRYKEGIKQISAESTNVSVHIKNKLVTANKCLYILRTLRKKGYSQAELDELFGALVLPKFMYGVSVHGCSPPQLTTIQCFLDRNVINVGTRPVLFPFLIGQKILINEFSRH